MLKIQQVKRDALQAPPLAGFSILNFSFRTISIDCFLTSSTMHPALWCDAQKTLDFNPHSLKIEFVAVHNKSCTY
jgi:hypothetical protein